MASHSRSTSIMAGATREKTHFELQREALIGEIAMSFEHVLANINKLNRSLEAVVAVGNEFSSVEALWSQFENVMAKDEGAAVAGSEEHEHEHEHEHDQGEEHHQGGGIERSTTPKGEPS